MPDPTASLYEQYFYAWANEQAALLRAGQLSAADVEHIAEETESMGRTEKRELVSRLTVLLVQLLKWQFQPTHRGPSWRLSIANARDDLTDHLCDNPSLKAHLANAIESAYRRATGRRRRKPAIPKPPSRTPARGRSTR